MAHLSSSLWEKSMKLYLPALVKIAVGILAILPFFHPAATLASTQGICQEDIVQCRKMAEQGDAVAQFHVGEAYAYGLGDEWDQDHMEALKWYRLSAEQGHLAAQYKLGTIYDTRYSFDYDERSERYYSIDHEVERNDAEAAKWYRLAAEQGDANAQYHFGQLHAEGRGIAKNDAEAAKWYRKAAEQGHVDAQYQLGEMAAEGRSLAKNETEALKWFKKAAEQGHAGAMHRLWEFHAEGRGVPKDASQALEWLKKAADLGVPDSQYNLGITHEEGRGVAKNDAEAAKWYGFAAEQEHAAARNRLGRMYATGRGLAYNDAHKARQCFTRAAEQGDAISHNSLGEQIKKAAAAGDAEAQTILGVIYSDYRVIPETHAEEQHYFDLMAAGGRGIQLNNAEAAKWFRLAAEQGFAAAQYYFGNVYSHGEDMWGVAQSGAETLKWYGLAAAQGNAPAQYSVGDMYASGTDVEKNDAEAAKWFMKAAENGYPSAQYEIGKRYVEGIGLATDYKEAAKWLEKAIELGEERAEEILQFVNYALKSDFSCDDISGKNYYSIYTTPLGPLKIKEMIVCVKEQSALDLCTPVGQHLQYRPPQEQEKIRSCQDQVWSKFPPDKVPTTVTIYSITPGRQPIAADGGVFEMKGHEDKIRDITSLDINGDGRDEVVVIHESYRYDVANSKKTTYPRSSPWYHSVTVFEQKETGLSRNERASEWFGSDFGRWHSDSYTIAFDFPYHSYESVKKALSSPYAALMVRDAAIPVTVRCKSPLYDLPSLEKKSEKFLITGDRATVDKHTAGWCRINYSDGKTPVQMWMRCDELLAEGQSDTRKCPPPLTEKEKKLLQMLNFSG